MAETEHAQPGIVDLAPQPKSQRDSTGNALTKLLAIFQGKGFCPMPGPGQHSDDCSAGGTPRKYPQTPGEYTAATEGCTPLDLTPRGEEETSPLSSSSGSSSPIASGSWTAVDQVAIDQQDVFDVDVDADGAVEAVLSPVLGKTGTEQKPTNGGEVDEASVQDNEHDVHSGGEADPVETEAEEIEGEGENKSSIAGEEMDAASDKALELRRVTAVTVGKEESTLQVDGSYWDTVKHRNLAAAAAFVVAIVAVLLRGMGSLQSLINPVS